MQTIILDTETHTLNGLPIEIAYAPIEINEGKLTLDKSKLFDQLYQVGAPISYAAMAVHHILESDLENQGPTIKTLNCQRLQLILLVTILITILPRLLVVVWMYRISNRFVL